jgi:hypothetical protein
VIIVSFYPERFEEITVLLFKEMLINISTNPCWFFSEGINSSRLELVGAIQ